MGGLAWRPLYRRQAARARSSVKPISSAASRAWAATPASRSASRSPRPPISTASARTRLSRRASRSASSRTTIIISTPAIRSGFKGGGFDPRGQTTNAPGNTPATRSNRRRNLRIHGFRPGNGDELRAGLEGRLFDKRLFTAVALFHADYKDVQVPGSVGCVRSAACQLFCGITTNAGKARIPGRRGRRQWASPMFWRPGRSG